MRGSSLAIVGIAAALAYACGSSNTAKKDAAVDSKAVDAPAGSGAIALTVKNYLSWCNVRVGSAGTFSSAGVQTVMVGSGQVALAARALTGFELGSDMWHHVDGDTGSGFSGVQTGSGSAAQSDANVTVSSAAKCVWVCCPFANTGSGCSGLPDQCP